MVPGKNGTTKMTDSEEPNEPTPVEPAPAQNEPADDASPFEAPAFEQIEANLPGDTDLQL